MTLDQELSQALVNLAKSPDFQLFVTRLGHDLDQTMERLVMQTENKNVELLRGDARRLTLILKSIAEAPDKLQQFKTKGTH